jgi:hypothetical protein
MSQEMRDFVDKKVVAKQAIFYGGHGQPEYTGKLKSFNSEDGGFTLEDDNGKNILLNFKYMLSVEELKQEE